jgi:hypothetical protein
MCVQIDGTIVAPSDPTTWPANSKRNWLVFYKADGVSLTGAGLIDGKGQKWWDLPCKPHKVRTDIRLSDDELSVPETKLLCLSFFLFCQGGSTHGPCDSPVVSGLTQPRI